MNKSMGRWLPVHWRVYRTRAFAIALTWSLFVFFSYRAFDALNNKSFVDASEQIAPIVALIIALLAGTQFSWARRTSASIEQDEDKSIQPWRKVNHSFPELRWATAEEECSPNVTSVREFLYKNSSPFFRLVSLLDLGGKINERLLEDTGTENYRVLSFLWPSLFIRVYKHADVKSSLADIELRTRVAGYLIRWDRRRRYVPDIFEWKYARGLEPQKLRSRLRKGLARERIGCLHRSTFGIEQSIPGQIFPYIDAETHFCGNLEQITSFAKKFGGLFGLLSELEEEANIAGTEGNKIVALIRDTSKEGTLGDLPPRRITRHPDAPDNINCAWSRIKAKALEDKENPVFRLIFQNNGELKPWLEASIAAAIEARMASRTERTYLLLHDVHPHNTLFVGNECVLILDYSWIGDWPHSEVLAFTMHRFVREFVRLKAEQDGHFNNAAVNCRTGVEAFLQSYQEGFRSVGRDDYLPLPIDFDSNLWKYIAAANIDKFISSSERCLGLRAESIGRTVERQHGEVRKFVRFLHEAQSFKNAAV